MKLSQQDSWQDAREMAVNIAVEELRETDLQDRCRKSGAVWCTKSGSIGINFLNQTYRISPPEFEVALPEVPEEVPLTERILLLHYLKSASGTRPAGKWIGFSQLPGGELYLRNFQARSVTRVIRAFSGREDLLIGAGRSLSGNESDLGDISVTLNVLPHVPVTVLLWCGDDEFPQAGDFLFDATVTEYLDTEDVVVLAETVADRFCKWAALTERDVSTE